MMQQETWLPVCALAMLLPAQGRSARVGEQQLALFLLGERVYALDDRDPVSGIALLSRGIVGDLGGEPVVASPLYKQRYALMDGRCLDDPALGVRAWPTRLEGETIWVKLS
ncbi:nitrite reductase small subunit NirD [Aeromonas rivuli]|uniref:nitrite reductase small subunit NirD n=1 Tax=Aeromonas rivuli TaxID=648794 RepID=UPI001CC91242|nr:nitrite reductase small subunit NirD [Aeromonas rivuli]UBO74897.1 nitrite reductase small subunit NirD [Aeromonas rivuli]